MEKPIPAKGYLYILVVLYDGLSDELGIKEARRHLHRPKYLRVTNLWGPEVLERALTHLVKSGVFDVECLEDIDVGVVLSLKAHLGYIGHEDHWCGLVREGKGVTRDHRGRLQQTHPLEGVALH